MSSGVNDLKPNFIVLLLEELLLPVSSNIYRGSL